MLGLAASGIEDQCLRQAVFLLMPEAFLRPQPNAAATLAKQTDLDRLCDWMRANLHNPLALSDLE